MQHPFNEYGVPQSPALTELEHKLEVLVQGFIEEMIEVEKVGPVVLQALERHVCMVVTQPFTERLLLMQSEMYTQRREARSEGKPEVHP